ncbi:hypothetical protein ACFO0M_15890 [Micromonospora mangrovi]|uniref:ABC transporter permease n=2 Tax=Micromonospora TaxID=1873 RepID=A0AAU8HH75_9ACTN
MGRDLVDIGPDESTLDALRRAVGTRRRKWLLAGTLLLGLTAAVALSAAGQPGDRTLDAMADPVQSLMSVAVPLIGILLAHDLRHAPRTTRLTPTLLAGVLVAAAVGVFGTLACVVALALVPSGTASDPWRHAGTIALGGVLVQVVAVLVGIGLGLLLRSTVLAFLGTIVLPLGCWAVLGAVDVLRPAQALTPYASVRHLLSGRMDAAAWAQWCAVLLIWGVGLTALGASRRRRSTPETGSARPQ